MANTIEIKLVKSLNGRLAKHKATAEALGLRHIGDVTVQPPPQPFPFPPLP